MSEVYGVDIVSYSASNTFYDRLRKQGDVMSSVTEEHIDIYYQGYVFRFEIFYPREVLLLDKLIVNRSGNDAVNEKHVHMIDRPSLAGLMHSLHLKHSSFGLAAR